jgi:catechol 2,3-dioxygenase-like lactoylglutathione lyase family enzyme
MNADAKKPFSLKMVSPLEPGIVCVDIDPMLDFYSRVLGLTIVSDDEATAKMSAIFGAAPHGFRIIRLQTPFGERVKLVHAKNAHIGRIQPPEWVFDRQGIAYITFIVSNIYEVAARLTEHEVKLVRPRPVEVRRGFVALFANDPEGNFVEFVEYVDISSYRQDLSHRLPACDWETKD